jgi:hypothetical protein
MAILQPAVMETAPLAQVAQITPPASAVDPKGVLEGGRVPPQDFPVCREDLVRAAAEGVWRQGYRRQAAAAGLVDSVAAGAGAAPLRAVPSLQEAPVELAVLAGDTAAPLPLVLGNPEAAGLLSAGPSSCRTASVRSPE